MLLGRLCPTEDGALRGNGRAVRLTKVQPVPGLL